MANFIVSINEELDIQDFISARMRTNYALHHLFAVCRYTALIKDIEEKNKDQNFGGFWEEIFQHSLAVAMLSVACIEAYANEIYFDMEKLSPKLNIVAAKLIKESVEKKCVLDKYGIACELKTGKKLNKSCFKYQNAKLLIKLRNEVTHFKPEWSDEQVKHLKLSECLAEKFKPSIFFPSSETLFPRAWASHDFANWALTSTIEFLDYFYEQIGEKSPINDFREQIRELSTVSPNETY